MGKYPNGNYHRGEAWQKIHGKRFDCNCAKCGKGGQKSEMPGLYLRKHNDSHRILCRFCSDCLPRFLDDLGVKMPE